MQTYKSNLDEINKEWVEIYKKKCWEGGHQVETKSINLIQVTGSK